MLIEVTRAKPMNEINECIVQFNNPTGHILELQLRHQTRYADLVKKGHWQRNVCPVGHPADNLACWWQPSRASTWSIPISGQPASSVRLRILRTTDQSHGPSDAEEDGRVVHLRFGPGQSRNCVLSSHLPCPISPCSHLWDLGLLFCLFSHLHPHIRNSYRRL